MTIFSRIFAVAAASAALLTVTAPAHATDVLNLVNAKRVPVSVLSEGNTSADNVIIEQDAGSWAGPASRPYEEDAAEALLASLIGHDYEE
jgi:hypothetical protein